MCIFADIILKVRQPLAEEVKYFKENGTLISFLYPVQNKTLVDQLAKKHMTVFGKCLFYAQFLLVVVKHFLFSIKSTDFC